MYSEESRSIRYISIYLLTSTGEWETIIAVKEEADGTPPLLTIMTTGDDDSARERAGSSGKDRPGMRPGNVEVKLHIYCKG